MKRGTATKKTLPVILAALVVLLVVISGCSAEADIESRVEADGSGQIQVRMSLDQGLADIVADQVPDLGLTNPVFEDLVNRFSGDWTVTSGTGDDGGRWLEAGREFADPEDYGSVVAENEVLASVFNTGSVSLTQEKQLFKTTTVFQSEGDSTAAVEELQEGLGPVDLVRGVVEVEHRLTLPGEIKSTNADTVDGSTVTWKLGSGGSTVMSAESVVYRWNVIAAVAAGGGLLVIGGSALLIWLLVRRRRTSRADQPATAAEAAVSEDRSRAEGPIAAAEPGAGRMVAADAIPLPAVQMRELPASGRRLLDAATGESDPAEDTAT